MKCKKKNFQVGMQYFFLLKMSVIEQHICTQIRGGDRSLQVTVTFGE